MSKLRGNWDNVDYSANSQHGRKSWSAGAIYHGYTGQNPRDLYKPETPIKRKRAPKARVSRDEAVAERMDMKAKIAKARQLAKKMRANGEFDGPNKTTAKRCTQKSVYGEVGYNE